MKKLSRFLTVLVLLLLTLLIIIYSYLRILPGQVARQEEKEPIKTTLRVAVWDYPQLPYLQNLFAGFEKNNPDIELQVVSYDRIYYWSNLFSMLQNNEPLDLFFIGNPDQLSDIALQSKTMVLDSMLRSNDISPARYSSYLDPLRHPITQELMALPFRVDKYMLIYNRSLLSKMNVRTPFPSMTLQTFSDYLRVIQEGNEKTPYSTEQNPQPLCLFPFQPRDAFFILTGADFATCENPVERLRAGMDIFKRMQADGTTFSWAQNDAAEQHENMFTLGSVPLVLASSAYLQYLQALPLNFRFCATLAPHVPQQQTPLLLTSVGIYKKSQNKDAAWRFLNYLCGPEGASYLAAHHIVPAYQDKQIAAQIRNSASVGSEFFLQLPTENDAVAHIMDYFSLSDTNRFLELYTRVLLGIAPEEEAAALFEELVEKKDSPNYFGE